MKNRIIKEGDNNDGYMNKGEGLLNNIRTRLQLGD